MSSKIMNTAILASVLLAFAAPTVSFAAAPKTKAECEKAKMKWDDATSKCTKEVKK